MKIMLAEDETMLRTALATLINLEPDMTVVVQVGRGDEIAEAARLAAPDVALVDIELPGMSGIDAIPGLLAAVPACAVIVLTTFGRPGYLTRALEAGARGFLLKDIPVEVLAKQIRAVVGGAVVVDPALAASTRIAQRNPLTEREREVLAAGARGDSIAQIAAALHLSASTVRNYLSSAIGKTRTGNRTAAARRAEENGWL